jgi:hypothetical protein
MPSWYHLQIDVTMPLNRYGILLIITSIPTQPIGILINPTNPVNNIKIIFL